MFITTYFLHIESTLDSFNGTLFIKLVTKILSKKAFDSYWEKSDFIVMVVIFVFFILIIAVNVIGHFLFTQFSSFRNENFNVIPYRDDEVR